MSNKEVIKIQMETHVLGFKWGLFFRGTRVAGGYEQTIWKAMDAASEALVRLANQVKLAAKGMALLPGGNSGADDD